MKLPTDNTIDLYQPLSPAFAGRFGGRIGEFKAQETGPPSDASDEALKTTLITNVNLPPAMRIRFQAAPRDYSFGDLILAFDWKAIQVEHSADQWFLLTGLPAGEHSTLPFSFPLDAFCGALNAEGARRVCLDETHRGTVIDAEGDEIAVVYDTDDGEVEQVYHRDQLIDGKLPNVGDLVEARVIVTTRPDASDEDATATGKGTHDFRAFREKRIRGPIEI